MRLHLDCSGVAFITKATDEHDQEFVCPYSGEFIDEGDVCLVLKEKDDPEIDPVWFKLKYISEFSSTVNQFFEKDVDLENYTFRVCKISEAVRVGIWDQGKECLICGDIVGAEKSIYFLGLYKEGFEFIHHDEQCVKGFCDLIQSIDQYSAEICSMMM